jgi:dihydrodipicolinate synthase/N-acetylneuraminate lyase
MTQTKKKYCGVVVPMVSPLNKDFSIDTKAVVRILETFINLDISPFILGTTGESVSIGNKEKILLVKTTVDYIKKRNLVYAGISGNCLQESIEQAKFFADMGADATVAHLPFYYPISSSQMLKYFEQLAEKISIPLILYNMPATTKTSIPLEVIEKLSHHPNIAGLKDSERGLDRLDKAIELWHNRSDFSHFTGWAAQSANALKKGSDGIIPSTGNLTPKLYIDLYLAVKEGNFEKAEMLQEKTNKISEIYQKDRDLSQSIPALKYMMSIIGLCQSYAMPPMFEPDVKEKEQIKSLLEKTALN